MSAQHSKQSLWLKLLWWKTFLLALVLSAPIAAGLEWEIEVVENGTSFVWMTTRSLRLDGQGNPHIAYGGNHLYHAFHDGIAWHYEVADLSPSVGSYTSLALDDSGRPHISYYDFTNGDLKYVYALGPAPIVLTASFANGQLVLNWTTVTDAAAYWVYGMANEPWFLPDLSPPTYVNRIAIVPGGTTTWTSSSGIGDPDNNWTYLVIAMGEANSELVRSNRVGEHDFDCEIP